METKAKPQYYIPKSRRGVVGSKASAKTPLQPVPHADSSLPITADISSQAEMQTKAAVRLFLRRIEKIADAQIVRRGTGEIYPLAFTVEVPDLWSEAADHVYTLRGDLYRKYPDAEIEIEVRGRRECGGAMNRMEQDEEP